LKIEFKAVTRRIELQEYDESLAGGFIDVWVNVTREVIQEMRIVSAETPAEDFMGLLGKLWNPTSPLPSPSGARSAWPMEDIVALRDHCLNQDPRLWLWVTDRTWNLVMEYQGYVKKK
jgi:hypothetical protein